LNYLKQSITQSCEINKY